MRDNAQRASLLVVLLAWLGLVQGCATTAAAGKIAPSSAFTAQDATVFDDAVDLLSDPQGLDGAWGDSWRRDLEVRAKRADVVAIVTIETVVSDVDLQRRRGVRLNPVVVRTMRGRLPADLGLRVSQGQPGYASIDVNRRQLLAGEYLLFIKWALDEQGVVGARWHIAPASESLLASVEEALGVAAKSNSRVVIHRN